MRSDLVFNIKDLFSGILWTCHLIDYNMNQYCFGWLYRFGQSKNSDHEVGEIFFTNYHKDIAETHSHMLESRFIAIGKAGQIKAMTFTPAK